MQHFRLRHEHQIRDQNPIGYTGPTLDLISSRGNYAWAESSKGTERYVKYRYFARWWVRCFAFPSSVRHAQTFISFTLHVPVPSVPLPSNTSINSLSLSWSLMIPSWWSIEVLAPVLSSLLLTPSITLLVLVLHLLSIHLLRLSLLVHHGHLRFSSSSLAFMVFMFREDETATDKESVFNEAHL